MSNSYAHANHINSHGHAQTQPMAWQPTIYQQCHDTAVAQPGMIEDYSEPVEIDEDADSAYSSLGGVSSSVSAFSEPPAVHEQQSIAYTIETTSVSSSIYRGFVENGRRYQVSQADNPYFSPSDDQQFESIELTHIVYTVMDSQERNPLFRSPIRRDAKHIIDIGCGDGSWVIDVADQNPHVTVWGVDLFPPPKTYVPANCILEVDDIMKPWTWQNKFDLINLRLLLGSFREEQWDHLYKEIYKNLEPGGWIEQVEVDIEDHIKCEDRTMPANAKLRSYGDLLNTCAKSAGTRLDICRRMRGKIEAAGFINVQEKRYKIPIGGWAKHPIYKDAGKAAMRSFKLGMQGWSQFFLTKHAQPRWSERQVEQYLMELNEELDKNWHIFLSPRRIWAQKPFDPPRESFHTMRDTPMDMSWDGSTKEGSMMDGSRTPQHYSQY